MSPNLAIYTYGMIPSASDTAITEILKHGLQVPICGLQVPICGSAPRMSAPRLEQTTRAATIFVYTHTQDDRSLRVQQPACKLASCFQIFRLRLRLDCRLLGFNENSPAAQHLSLLFFKKFKTNNPKFLLFSS